MRFMGFWADINSCLGGKKNEVHEWLCGRRWCPLWSLPAVVDMVTGDMVTSRCHHYVRSLASTVQGTLSFLYVLFVFLKCRRTEVCHGWLCLSNILVYFFRTHGVGVVFPGSVGLGGVSCFTCFTFVKIVVYRNPVHYSLKYSFR